jgi:hypothetical protein
MEVTHMVRKILALWFLLGVMCASGGELGLVGKPNQATNPQNSDILVQKFTAQPEGSFSAQQTALVEYAMKYVLGTLEKDEKVACPIDETGKVISGPYIVHVATWNAKSDDGTYSLKSSQWHAFRLKKIRGTCSLRGIVSLSTGQPILYGAKSAWLVGINHFPAPVMKSEISIIYKVSTAPAKPENAQNFGALLAALTGATAPQAVAVVSSSQNYVVFQKVSGLAQLPFDFNISPSVTPLSSQLSLSPQLPDATLNQPYEQNILAKGGTPPISFSTPDAAKLPHNLSLSGKGVIQGTPDKLGQSAFSVTVKDSSAPPQTATGDITINVGPAGAPLTVSSQLADATANQAYQQRLMVRGGTAPVTFSTPDPAKLPHNLNLSPNGVIQGTPDKPGSSEFSVTAQDSSIPSQKYVLDFVMNVVAQQANPPAGGPSTPQKTGAGQQNNQAGSANAQQASPSSNTPVDCTTVSSSAACTFTHTVRSFDKEWWDVSLAMAIPGVLEPKYSASNLAAPPSFTRHSDLYGMLDLYLASKWATKDSAAPHVLVGLPVTGQPFYRPFFGLAENASGWTALQKHGILPFRLNLFFGFVDMHQEYVTKNSDTAAGQPALVQRPERVWKPMFGIELPVSALASKIGGASKSGSGTKTGSSN